MHATYLAYNIYNRKYFTETARSIRVAKCNFSICMLISAKKNILLHSSRISKLTFENVKKKKEMYLKKTDSDSYLQTN